MWPGPEEPDLGSFLVPIRDELERRGHAVELVAIDHRRRSRTKYARLTAEAIAAARRFRPDVIFAHVLFPAGASGLAASLAGRAPLVVMAHGQDVANIGSIPGVRAATRAVVARAAGLILNSRWLADRLTSRVPAAEGKIAIADCGVDLEAFAPTDQAAARHELGWPDEGPGLLCVGSLIERKNVVRLAAAFERVGEGRLAFVGDGELRPQLEGRPGIRVIGRVSQAQVRPWIAAADVVCQPSLIEPFGMAALEAMAMERSVLGTRVGGPPEFVTAEAGVLVDPEDPDGLAEGLAAATALPTPNPAARRAAREHSIEVQVGRMEAALQAAVG